MFAAGWSRVELERQLNTWGLPQAGAGAAGRGGGGAARAELRDHVALMFLFEELAAAAGALPEAPPPPPLPPAGATASGRVSAAAAARSDGGGGGVVFVWVHHATGLPGAAPAVVAASVGGGAVAATAESAAGASFPSWGCGLVIPYAGGAADAPVVTFVVTGAAAAAGAPRVLGTAALPLAPLLGRGGARRRDAAVLPLQCAPPSRGAALVVSAYAAPAGEPGAPRGLADAFPADGGVLRAARLVVRVVRGRNLARGGGGGGGGGPAKCDSCVALACA